jgi:hypothetical protein
VSPRSFFLQRGRRVLAHLGDGGRPSWRPVVGVLLPPVWPQAQPVPMTAAGATVAALTGSTRGPSSGPDGRCQRDCDGRRGGSAVILAPGRSRRLAPRRSRRSASCSTTSAHQPSPDHRPDRITDSTPRPSPRAGGSACKPRILGIGADSGHQEHRSPSMSVATEARGWRSTFRRSTARLVQQPGQNRSSHGLSAISAAPDRRRPCGSIARIGGRYHLRAPARITRATTPSPPCRGLPIQPAFARRPRPPTRLKP